MHAVVMIRIPFSFHVLVLLLYVYIIAQPCGFTGCSCYSIAKELKLKNKLLYTLFD